MEKGQRGIHGRKLKVACRNLRSKFNDLTTWQTHKENNSPSLIPFLIKVNQQISVEFLSEGSLLFNSKSAKFKKTYC